jgi:hypothetical protein
MSALPELACVPNEPAAVRILTCSGVPDCNHRVGDGATGTTVLLSEGSMRI